MTDNAVEQALGRMGRGMLYLAWLVALALLTWYFQFREEAARNPNSAPQSALLADGTREVVLQRNDGNHYVATGHINGVAVNFLLDTGATLVVVPERLARRLGLEAGVPGIARTANGDVRTYFTRIARLELGNIVLENVRASISTGESMDEVLLGMSALGQLELLQRGAELRLRQHAGAEP